jgi:hypothetical protein
MPTAMQDEPEATEKSLEMDIAKNVHELKPVSAIFRQSENSDDENLDNSLDKMLGRVSESPRREIEYLIGELQTLHIKLETNRDRIHRDIVEYAGISQQVMQLTTIISDSVKSLPRPPAISR